MKNKYKSSKKNILQDPPQHYKIALCKGEICMKYKDENGVMKIWNLERSLDPTGYKSVFPEDFVIRSIKEEEEIIEQC